MFYWLICTTQWGMWTDNNALKPSIERIKKLPYFDEESYMMETRIGTF